MRTDSWVIQFARQTAVQLVQRPENNMRAVGDTKGTMCPKETAMEKKNRLMRSLLRISEATALSASAAIHAMALERRGEDMVDLSAVDEEGTDLIEGPETGVDVTNQDGSPGQ